MATDRIHAYTRQELGTEILFENAPLLVSEHISGQNSRGHAISLLYRCTLLKPPGENTRARSDPPSPGEWRWHVGCPPDLLDAQTHYRRFL